MPYIDMNQPWVYMCPHPEHPSHLPPHPIPQGHPSAPALSALSHASNLDWQSISHMVIYMFQCYSLFFWLSARCMTEILKQCIPFKFSISWCFCVAFRVVFSGLSSNSLVSSLMIMYVCAKLLQTCLTLCDPMNCSLPGSSVCGISQARILEWVAISSCKGSSRPRDWTCVSNVSCIGRQVLYH